MHNAAPAYENNHAYAHALDKADALATYRAQFYLPRMPDGTPQIYFVGNSLGLQPRGASKYVNEIMEAWAELGAEGHVQGERPFKPYHENLTPALAQLIGAQSAEVVAMNNLTVNLHLLMVSFYRPTPQRFKIVMEKGAFPSDVYAVKSQLRLHGYSPEHALVYLAPRPGEDTLRTDDIAAYFEREGSSVALLLLGGVNYYTGQYFDLQSITRSAQAAGAQVCIDLAHAIANVPLRLHDWGIDCAAWCGYKYLNGGPGATAGIFVHEKHHTSKDMHRLEGWWGHADATRFKMLPDFTPSMGAEAWQLSNPSVLGMAPLIASLQLFQEAGIERLRAKSERLTGYLQFMLDALHSDRIQVITPQAPQARGCQLSIRVKGGDKRLHTALVQQGVQCDWREPDVVRVAPAPMYNTYEEVYRFVQILKNLLHAI